MDQVSDPIRNQFGLPLETTVVAPRVVIPLLLQPAWLAKLNAVIFEESCPFPFFQFTAEEVINKYRFPLFNDVDGDFLKECFYFTKQF